MSDDEVLDCPLCGGPLRSEQAARLECEVGHGFDLGELHVSASHRAAIALWSAVAALEDEAAALRYIGRSTGDDAMMNAATQADEDVRLLRRIAGIQRDDAGVDRAEHST